MPHVSIVYLFLDLKNEEEHYTLHYPESSILWDMIFTLCIFYPDNPCRTCFYVHVRRSCNFVTATFNASLKPKLIEWDWVVNNI